MTDDFRPGVTYIIHTRTGAQKLEREHCMTFLGHEFNPRDDLMNSDLVFNARPFAGTQVIRLGDITSYHPIGRAVDSRENPAHYMNKVVRNVR